MSNVRHVLGISGGKDSAALAVYLRRLGSPRSISSITSWIPEKNWMKPMSSSTV